MSLAYFQRLSSTGPAALNILEVTDSYGVSVFGQSVLDHCRSSFTYNVESTIAPISSSLQQYNASSINWVHIAAPRREYEVVRHLQPLLKDLTWVSIDAYVPSYPSFRLPRSEVNLALNQLEDTLGFMCKLQPPETTDAERVLGKNHLFCVKEFY